MILDWITLVMGKMGDISRHMKFLVRVDYQVFLLLLHKEGI